MYWPYDEVTLKAGANPAEFLVEAPWLGTSAVLASEELDRAGRLAGKFAKREIGAQDIAELNWFFGPLAKYPFCYTLPRTVWEQHLDRHTITDDSLLSASPREFLLAVITDARHAIDARRVAKASLYQGPWKWDAEGALQFSYSTEGIDPVALFSVARRFHLLSSVESNSTARLYAKTKSWKGDPEKFARASRLMVRQNHYVTERCETALAPALELAKSAKIKVQHFMQEEYGHDRLLKAALLTLTNDPESIPVTSYSKILMDLLQFSARRNFLAFTMIVDFFERSSYQSSDPLAELLSEGGLSAAARHIDRHHAINDAGEHENVAQGFLENMAPVDKNYATEALRLAEATTNAMNLIAFGVEQMLN